MFDQICTGLDYMEDLCDSIFILPAKYPILLSQTLEIMLSEDAPCVRPVFEGHRGHPILLRKELFSEILTYTGENGLRGALRQPSVAARTAEVSVSDSGIILSADTVDSDTERFNKNETLPIYAVGEFQLCRETPFFTSETARFLMLIEHTGSMQTACRHMQISYSKGWKTIKSVENHLGFSLLHTKTGGDRGGSSSLTKEGKTFLQNYLHAEEQLSAYASELFQEIFIEKKINS
ncbi:MAG: NTP transferase domain-containing protein [Faecalimonas umbilicata]